MLYYVAGGCVLIAASIVDSGVRALGRVNNGPESLLDEAQSIGVGELA
jgi:hypothetical protein